MSCVEEIELASSGDFESAVVVEATITNEFKIHNVLLSRTFKIGDTGPVPESNADVSIIDGNGNVFEFKENELGVYSSIELFRAVPNLDYQLIVMTSNGDRISSKTMQLTNESPMDDLYIERGYNENNVEGISAFVDTYNALGNAKYYRFEYEETYKIVAPLYSPIELVPNDVQFPILSGELDSFGLDDIIELLVIQKFRDEQEQICFNTIASNTILQANTSELNEDRLDHFRVRFIGRSNYSISHRYSIKVRQYVQSFEGHTYYKLLNEFSGSENIFSETQVGRLEGNLVNVDDSSKFVIGFFEISSVDEKRVYFNYADLFPQEPLPPYYTICDDYFRPPLLEEDYFHNITNSPLLDFLNVGMQYYEEVDDFNPSPFEYAPFRLVIEPCGDCTVLGENYPPVWWED